MTMSRRRTANFHGGLNSVDNPGSRFCVVARLADYHSGTLIEICDILLASCSSLRLAPRKSCLFSLALTRHIYSRAKATFHRIRRNGPPVVLPAFGRLLWWLSGGCLSLVLGVARNGIASLPALPGDRVLARWTSALGMHRAAKQ